MLALIIALFLTTPTSLADGENSECLTNRNPEIVSVKFYGITFYVRTFVAIPYKGFKKVSRHQAKVVDPTSLKKLTELLYNLKEAPEQFTNEDCRVYCKLSFSNGAVKRLYIFRDGKIKYKGEIYFDDYVFLEALAKALPEEIGDHYSL